MFEEFGEVVFSKGKNFPKGMVLRSKEDRTVVLEEYFDTFMEHVDVIHMFGKSYSLEEEKDLEYCLDVAREYERNLDVPIYVFQGDDESTTETVSNNNRAEQITRMVKWNQIHPWSVMLPIRN